jgi:hypothetical protein
MGADRSKERKVKALVTYKNSADKYNTYVESIIESSEYLTLRLKQYNLLRNKSEKVGMDEINRNQTIHNCIWHAIENVKDKC